MTRLIWALLAVALAARPLEGQTDSTDSAQQQPTPAAIVSAPRVFSLRQVVRFTNGKPVVGASLTALPIDTAVTRKAFVDTTDAFGMARLDSLPPTVYAIRLDYEGREPFVEQVALDSSMSLQTVVPLPVSRGSEISLTLFALFLYGASVLFTRWHHIARSVHQMVVRQIAALQTRLHTEVAPTDRTRLLELEATLKELNKEWTHWCTKRPSLWEFFFWSRGRENAVWAGVHEVERQLGAFLSPPAHVEVSLRAIAPELRSIDRSSALAIAGAIEDSLKLARPASDPERAEFEDTRRALLGRAIAIVTADRDMEFSTLMEWQNKAGWLILTAVILIAFLVIAAGHAVLLLAGAAGGYLSRLMRALRRERIPLDYGASWTTLFLSPLFGALAAWFGIAIISLLVQPDVELLGAAFEAISWNEVLSPVTLAAAFMLGFSERFFDAVVGALDKHADATAQAQEFAKKTAGSQPATPAAPTETPKGGRPAISAIERQRRSERVSEDALIIKGSRFLKGAKARVNDIERDVVFQSSERLALSLTADDVKRIEAGGDTTIVIVNPDGGVSDAFDFA